MKRFSYFSNSLLSKSLENNVFRQFLIFSISVLPFYCYSQYEREFINGFLVDVETGSAVVFATIKIKDKALGVISNKDGGFKIPFSFQTKGKVLEISSMGYKLKTVVFSELKRNEVNQIFLTPSIEHLSETVVIAKKKKRKPSAKQIIRYAFEKIPLNYNPNSFELAGYYRDYQLQQGEYINLNEALIHVFDKGFEENDYTSTQFAIYEYLNNKKFNRDRFSAKHYDLKRRDKFIPDATLTNDYVSNELALLFIHDALRNHSIPTYSFVNTLVDDFIRKHRFPNLRNTSYGNEMVYQIEFKRNNSPHQVLGAIYIDKDDYAIRKLDYAVYKQKEIDNGSSIKYDHSAVDLLFEISVEYKEFDDYMYLNYISFHNKFMLRRPPKFFIESVGLLPNKTEMQITLNKPAANWDYLKPGDFDVFYDSKRLDVISISKKSKFVYALKILPEPKNLKIIDLLWSEAKKDLSLDLHIEAEKMVDSKGNVLGFNKEIELLNQFREFFTQKIFPNATIMKNDSLMIDKTKFLGHPQQPKMNIGLKPDFWMNSPLKN